MKNLSLNILAMSFLIIYSAAPKAKAGGGDIYYGGDPIIAQFHFLQIKNLEAIKKIPDELLPIPMLPLLYSAMINETVVGVDEVVYNQSGFAVTCINYPLTIPKKIIISRTLWPKVLNKETMDQYQVLALHETIHLIGYDDSNYAYSIPIVDLMRKYAGINSSDLQNPKGGVLNP